MTGVLLWLVRASLPAPLHDTNNIYGFRKQLEMHLFSDGCRAPHSDNVFARYKYFYLLTYSYSAQTVWTCVYSFGCHSDIVDVSAIVHWSQALAGRFKARFPLPELTARVNGPS